MTSFPPRGLAVVIGASGGIGRAVADAIDARGEFAQVLCFSRTGDPSIDLTSEPSIAKAARQIADTNRQLRLVFDASGFLHSEGVMPEKSWAEIDPLHMQHAFAINAIGPALLMKHLLPLLPAEGKSVFATLSAKVGSIGDNALGGWYAYRASKAALNQLVKTASIELSRKRPNAICVALHPGTVDTGLSGPFTKSGLVVQTPEQAATDLLKTIAVLQSSDSGGFFDRKGGALPW